jgi:hypothetical protein
VATLLFFNQWRGPGDLQIDIERLDAFVEATESIGAAVSPLTLRLREWCEVFGEDSDAKFLIEGAAYGFDWTHQEPPTRFANHNHVEVEYEDRVSDKLEAMLAAGEIAEVSSGFPYCVSGLLAIPKDGGEDVRVCHNLAAPHGGSVNDFQEAPSMKFASVMSALALARPGGFMCKVDITSAYRHMACAPSWWRLHAFEWKGKTYVDTRLPFGSKGAVACFQRFSDALGRYVARQLPLAP